MQGQFILWKKAQYETCFKPREYETKEAMAQAVLDGAGSGGEYVMTRRMEMQIIDATETQIVAKEVPA